MIFNTMSRRVLDGDRPADAKAFSARLARLIGRGLRKG
jgi:molecular chaperone HtpG